MSREVQQSRDDRPEVNNRVSPVATKHVTPIKMAETKHTIATCMELTDILEAVNDIKDQMKNAEHSEHIVNEWKLLSKLIDRFLFWISLIIVVIYFIVVAMEVQTKPSKTPHDGVRV